MKRLLVVFFLLFVLSSCSKEEEPIVCEDNEIIVDGACTDNVDFCLDSFVDRTCYEITNGECTVLNLVCEENYQVENCECVESPPVCEEGFMLNEEETECIEIPPVCEGDLEFREGLCVTSDVAFALASLPPFVQNEMLVYDLNENELLEFSEADLITSLDLSSLNISNISFLSYMPNITHLTLSNNEIEDVSYLNNLLYLEEVYIDHNQVNNVCVFTSSNLRVLDISNNQVESIDCEDRFSNVEMLDASSNLIRVVNNMNQFSNIQTLHLANNKLFALKEMDQLSDLTLLDVSDNAFVFSHYFEDLVGSPMLERLDISNNKISSVKPFNSLTQLKEFVIDGNNFSDFVTLTDMTSLEYFSAKDQTIYDTEFLLGWSNVKEIIIEGRFLDGIEEFFFLPSLEKLDVRGLEITMNNVVDMLDLIKNGVNVTHDVVLTSSINPHLVTPATVYSYLNEDITLEELGIVAYDEQDGDVLDFVTTSVTDFASLELGEHNITFTVTDTNNNTTELAVRLVVRERIQMSNLVVFVKFSDYNFYAPPLTYNEYVEIYNGDDNSLQDYYLTISRGEYKIQSEFTHENIYFFSTRHPREYYQLKSPNNPVGYSSTFEKISREYEIIEDIIAEINANNLISEDVILDADNDGTIDAITLMMAGDREGWNHLLWPHANSMDSFDPKGNFTPTSPQINGKYVYDYNLQFLGAFNISESFYLGTITHEILHNIGAPDFYHYYKDDHISPIGAWGLMDTYDYTPTRPLMYVQSEYAGFDIDPIYVTENGTYFLQRSTLEEDNVIIIDLEQSNEYLYLEFRSSNGKYEENLPTDGVIVYRVDKDFYGNYNGLYDENMNAVDEVFIFREMTFLEEYLSEGRYIIDSPGEIDLAALTTLSNTEMGYNTTIPLFYSDGTEILLHIELVGFNPDQATILIEFIE